MPYSLAAVHAHFWLAGKLFAWLYLAVRCCDAWAQALILNRNWIRDLEKFWLFVR
jgi:hypothetical protein